jgi:hypothetical protein
VYRKKTMNQLKDFFESEKKRIFEPDAFFTERMMARLREGSTWEYGIWEITPHSTRPVLAIALALILCFVAIELLIPQMPQRGVVESFLEPEQSPAESFLYNETDIPARQVVLQQLITPEDQQ